MSEPITPCRLFKSSSVLDALSSLSPPSPILSPGQLMLPASSGDIPILFDSPSVCSIVSIERAAGDNIHRSKNSVPGPELPTSLSTSTVGTFGPVLRGNEEQRDHCRSSSTSHIYCQCIRNSAPTRPANVDFEYPLTGPSLRHSYSIGDPVAVPLASHERHHDSYSLIHGGRISRGTFHDVLLSPASDSSVQILQSMQPSQTFSTLPSLSFALPSPSPSVVSCPSSPRGHFPSDRPIFSEYPQIGDGSWMALPQEVPGSPGFREVSAALTVVQPNLPESASSTPTVSCLGHPRPDYRSNVKHATECAQFLSIDSHSQLSCPSPGSRYVFLPKNVFWLKGMIVELSIDQEGFRAVQASFRLMGYSRKSRALDLHSTDIGGVAEFMPSKRQQFHFHYAPFDSLPVLRRITVNGEESRDYISRQASLGLKSNGVYTVRGTETSSLLSSCSSGTSLTASHGSDLCKLRWKFDYMVDDRRIEASGRIMDGEKTLTPLTFSCSPILLHPLQGKKIRLIHVVKKSMASKLIAERLEPPMPRHRDPSPPTPLFPPSILKSNAQTTTNYYLGKSHAWNLHRRAKSHFLARDEDQMRPTRPGSRLEPRPTVHMKQIVCNGEDRENYAFAAQRRRRRASSAGEHSLNPRDLNGHNYPPTQSTCSSVSPQPAKHIIPRSRLTELWNANIDVTSTRDTSSFGASFPPDFTSNQKSYGITQN